MAKQQNRWKPWHKWVLGITVFIIFIAIIAINSDTPDNNKTLKETEITISAGKLLTEYHNNEVKADDQFKGKLIQVNGVVDEIGKSAFNDMYIYLHAGESGYIHCQISDNQKDSVSKLNKGQIVFITGYCDGLILGIPFIRDCKVTTE